MWRCSDVNDIAPGSASGTAAFCVQPPNSAPRPRIREVAAGVPSGEAATSRNPRGGARACSGNICVLNEIFQGSKSLESSPFQGKCPTKCNHEHRTVLPLNYSGQFGRVVYAASSRRQSARAWARTPQLSFHQQLSATARPTHTRSNYRMQMAVVPLQALALFVRVHASSDKFGSSMAQDMAQACLNHRPRHGPSMTQARLKNGPGIAQSWPKTWPKNGPSKPNVPRPPPAPLPPQFPSPPANS